MSKNVWSMVCLWAGLAPGCIPGPPHSPTRPNIIVVMADDHAQRAISAYDDTLIDTPNIDRLADEGILFTSSFVTNSICAPSRAVLLTGKYSHLNGVLDNANVMFDDAHDVLDDGVNVVLDERSRQHHRRAVG